MTCLALVTLDTGARGSSSERESHLVSSLTSLYPQFQLEGETKNIQISFLLNMYIVRYIFEFCPGSEQKLD